MEAKINEVFFMDAGEVRVPLGETKKEAVTIDGYRMVMSRNHISFEVEMGPTPPDGEYYTLLMGLFIDGVEVPYGAGWIRNDQENRTMVYSLSVPDKPVKLMAREPKIHSVQVKIGYLRNKFAVPYPMLSDFEYNLGESPVYYYKISKVQE